MLIRLAALLALAIVAAFPAAAETPSTVNASSLASIKSIGVISAVGDTLNIYTNGFTVLTHSANSHSISDMGIDDSLEALISQRISSGFKIEQVQYDREQFSALTPGTFLNPIIRLPPLGKLISALSAPVDAYLVISKAGVPFGVDDKILMPGINIGKGGAPFTTNFGMFAFINVSLFDARTHQMMAQVVYPAPISRFWGGKVEMLPFDGALWPDDAGNFTQIQHDELKKVLTDDLTAIVSKAVDQLGLISTQSQ